MPSVHPQSHYTDFNLPETHPSAPHDARPTLLSDIPGLFARLSTQGEILAATDSGVFSPGREFRYTGENVPDVDAAINHFQGMVRLARGRDSFLALSAGDSTELVSHIFLVSMGSRPVHGPWGSNLRTQGTPPPTDGIVRVIALDRTCWHAGGLALLGDVLAVPLEGGGASAVRFLHVADPLNPTQLPITIERPELANAGAAALGLLPTGNFLCLVWREEGKHAPVGRLDCYLSVTNDLFGKFGPRMTTAFPDFRPTLGRDPQYQSISLLHPDPAGGGPELFYLLATENGAGDAPFGNGPNLVDLFRILPPGPAGTQPPGTPIGKIEHVATAICRAPRTYCNFDAAGGTYVELLNGGARLSVYSAFHWRQQRTIHLTEFSGRPDATQPLTDIAEARIDLYEHDTFSGRTITIHGRQDADIPDYSRVFVQDGDLDERVSSVRWQLPTGWTYQLFREPGFAGASLDLEGTGLLKEIPDLSKRRFGDQVSSSRFASRP